MTSGGEQSGGKRNPFLEYYLSWAGPARRAYLGGYSVQLPGHAAAARKVVVCGMGGSGVSGDYVAALAAWEGGAPVAVVKGPEPPRWVGEDTLVVAVSFSGNTRETINCAALARERAAGLAAVTHGGRLAELAREWGVPLVVVEEAPAPRAGWPQLFYSLLGLLQSNGLLTVSRGSVEASLRLLEDREAVEKEAAPLAELLSTHRGPVAALTAEPTWPAAVRLSSEAAENAKTLVTPAYLAEAGHNLLEAMKHTEGLGLVLLDPGLEPWSSLLGRVAEEAEPARLLRVAARGGSLVEKLVWLTWVAGVATVEAALRKGVDPEELSAVKRFRGLVAEETRWGARPTE